MGVAYLYPIDSIAKRFIQESCEDLNLETEFRGRRSKLVVKIIKN